MKIVMLISSFHPLLGGAEKQAQRLGADLVSKGNNVTVLTRWHKGLKPEEKIDGLNVVRLKVSSNSKFAPIIYLIKVLMYMWKYKKDIDVVHAHALSAPGLTAALTSFVTGIPSIAKIAGGGNQLGCEIKRMYLDNIIGKLKVKFMQKHISRFIAISRAIEDDLNYVNTPSKKIVFLPNGIDKLLYQNKNQNEFHLKSKKTFLYVGRLEKVKGIDILMEAWSRINKQLKQNSQLIILGEGSIDISRFQTDESVEYMGKVDNVRDYLANADVFLLPSRYEGISNALLEAMASKLTIIASKVGGNPDLIKHGENGFLFERENIEQLQNLIEGIMSSQYDVSSIGEAAYKFIEKDYDLDKISNKYIKLYQQISN
ncbi:glycosyltransferase family 4 protein [Bacillus sp. F19]|nr:glycosyltransferase family 4 protein [Bacillus sp. F19]